jgi:structure-specific endonuclease subunit SLX1
MDEEENDNQDEKDEKEEENDNQDEKEEENDNQEDSSQKTKKFFVYILVSTDPNNTNVELNERPILLDSCLTYVGATVDLTRRLRQHNGIIKGGAKYTKKRNSKWRRICHVQNFPTWKEALKFEWKLKNIYKKLPYRKGKNVERRCLALEILLNSKKSTSTSLEFGLWPVKPKVTIELKEATHLFSKLNECQLITSIENSGNVF